MQVKEWVDFCYLDLIYPLGALMNLMPKQINSYFSAWFDCKPDIYCQLANQSDSKPHIRTMRLYAITDSGHLEFLSHTSTQKWSDWHSQPYAAVCFLNPDCGQILVEGTVQLKTIQTHPVDIKNYWRSLPKNIQMIYTELEEKEAPKSFGIVSIIPLQWEVLELTDEQYLLNSRILYQLINGTWKEKKIKITS
jgi:pyridoxine/pyridoxamine 5'-phosphate oxidase